MGSDAKTVVSIERPGDNSERRELNPGAATEVVSDGPVVVTVVAGGE